MVKIKEKAHNTIMTGENILDSGKMVKEMVKALNLVIMGTNGMKDNG